jgi:hypothetical protein
MRFTVRPTRAALELSEARSQHARTSDVWITLSRLIWPSIGPLFQALLELLDRENKALEAENRTPPQPDTPKQRDVEEGDAEYLGQLGGLIDTFADWSNPRGRF